MSDEKKHSCPRCGYSDPFVTDFQKPEESKPETVTATIDGREVQILASAILTSAILTSAVPGNPATVIAAEQAKQEQAEDDTEAAQRDAKVPEGEAGSQQPENGAPGKSEAETTP